MTGRRCPCERARWTGVGICAMADGLLIGAFRHLGRNLTDTVVTRREHTLVIDVRIAGSVIRFTSRSSCSCSHSLIAATGSVGDGRVGHRLLIMRTRTEEEKLLGRFWRRLRAYMERTGRFVPKIRANRPGA